MANKETKNLTRMVTTVKENKTDEEIAKGIQRCLLDNLSEDLKATATSGSGSNNSQQGSQQGSQQATYTAVDTTVVTTPVAGTQYYTLVNGVYTAVMPTTWVTGTTYYTKD